MEGLCLAAPVLILLHGKAWEEEQEVVQVSYLIHGYMEWCNDLWLEG